MSCASALAQRISSSESASLISLRCFHALAFGFGAGSEHSIRPFFERYVEMADLSELYYSLFYKWFSPGFVALL